MRISDWSSDVCSSDLTRREPGPAPDARRFPARIALPENDIVDPFGVDAAALDKGPEDQSSKLTGGQRRQPAAEFTDSCPDGTHDRAPTIGTGAVRERGSQDE